jgi:hypothetical protein
VPSRCPPQALRCCFPGLGRFPCLRVGASCRLAHVRGSHRLLGGRAASGARSCSHARHGSGCAGCAGRPCIRTRSSGRRPHSGLRGAAVSYLHLHLLAPLCCPCPLRGTCCCLGVRGGPQGCPWLRLGLGRCRLCRRRLGAAATACSSGRGGARSHRLVVMHTRGLRGARHTVALPLRHDPTGEPVCYPGRATCPPHGSPMCAPPSSSDVAASSPSVSPWSPLPKPPRVHLVQQVAQLHTGGRGHGAAGRGAQPAALEGSGREGGCGGREGGGLNASQDLSASALAEAAMSAGPAD